MYSSVVLGGFGVMRMLGNVSIVSFVCIYTSAEQLACPLVRSSSIVPARSLVRSFAVARASERGVVARNARPTF